MLLVGRALTGGEKGLYLGDLHAYVVFGHITLLMLN